jgi:BolA protein
MSIENIKNKLKEEFPDSIIELTNKTSQHYGHDNSGLHLKLKIVNPTFKDLSLVERHKLVYKALKQEMGNEIHALSIEAEDGN